MALELQGRQLEDFQDALVSAFPNYFELQRALRFGANVKLQEIAGAGTGMSQVIFSALDHFEQRGELDSLLAIALEFRPKNPKLQRFAMEIAVTSNKAPTGKLEALLNNTMLPEPYVDWKNRMEAAQSWVVRIEIPEGKAYGTGFLVGPRHILTNFHVAKIIEDTGNEARKCGARFQYHSASAGNANFISLAPDWKAANSQIDELDYALLRLDKSPSQSWAQPEASRAFEPQEILIVLQHPQTNPLRVAMGIFQKVTSPPMRAHYTVSTEAGSSGSPVLTSNWRAIALHQSGGGNENLGIPLSAIWKDLGEKQVAQELT